MDEDMPRRVRFRRRPKAAWKIALTETFKFLRENMKVFLFLLFLLAIATGHITPEVLVEKMTDPIALLTLFIGT
jgi:hypothetical protein